MLRWHSTIQEPAGIFLAPPFATNVPLLDWPAMSWGSPIRHTKVGVELAHQLGLDSNLLLKDCQ